MDWLNAQPKGSISSVGYELLRWIGSETDGKALVFEYVGPGDDGKYGKRFVLLNVKNKSLYTLHINTWHDADEVVTLASDIERALETFQATGLVTTDSTGSYRTIQNWECDATFHIPPDWVDWGILGESKILSPEDVRVNKEWVDTHPDLFENAEGEGPIGPDARSLYISCQDNLEKKDLKSPILKTIQIDGVDAYEIADPFRMPDGTPITNYYIVVGGGRSMEIYLGQTEYEDLPDVIKQIIKSISFAN